MSYAVKVEAHEEYIRIDVSGARMPGHEVSDAIDAGRQISEACRDNDVNKILLILRMTGRLRAIEAYEIFSNPKEFGWTHDVRVAFVDTNPESRDDSGFSETVAVNRAYAMKIFDNEQDARDWLLGP